MQIYKPEEIEKKSFEIISEILGDKNPSDINAHVIKRVIHTSADFDYLDNLVFSPDVVERTMEALKGGADIVTDTQMAKAGINKASLETLGGNVHCFISDPDIAVAAKNQGLTRATVSMEHAANNINKPMIFAIGNAPTALIKLHELITKGGFKPLLIIGVPVGFVNVVESKELIMSLDIPFIVAKGRKGGSNVAAAICNALIYDTIKKYNISD